MSNGQDLATEYADSMVESIAGIMARYAGEAHDDECERRAPECTCLSLDKGILLPHDDDCPVPAGEPVGECECQERARDELCESYALELVSEVGEPFSVLLTYGGPTAWVEWAGRRGPQSATLRVTWSSDVVIRRSGPIRALAEFYAETLDV